MTWAIAIWRSPNPRYQKITFRSGLASNNVRMAPSHWCIGFVELPSHRNMLSCRKRDYASAVKHPRVLEKQQPRNSVRMGDFAPVGSQCFAKRKSRNDP